MMSPLVKTDEGKSTVQERILNAAEILFANNSYSATRISDIAVKAGVNQALVHYYFSTKENLYGAVLERLFAQWETYLETQDWEDIEPDHVLRQYIRTHFDIKCKVPNLYKIFHKETVDGGHLFNQFASSKWEQDFRQKSEMFKSWKLAGIINSHVNEQVVLFCLWGMMNQFYYRELESLKIITGQEGTKEQLQEEVVNQMVALAQSGLLLHTSTPVEGEQQMKCCIQVLYLPSNQSLTESEDDFVKIIEGISEWANCQFQVFHSVEQWKEAGHDCHLLLIVTSSKYGELSTEVTQWMQYVENHSAVIADSFIGIWTTKESAARDHVQRLIEDNINRYGGFAVSKLPTHTVHGYLNRCKKMSGIK